MWYGNLGAMLLGVVSGSWVLSYNGPPWLATLNYLGALLNLYIVIINWPTKQRKG